MHNHKVVPVTGNSGCVSTLCLVTQHEARDFSHEWFTIKENNRLSMFFTNLFPFFDFCETRVPFSATYKVKDPLPLYKEAVE